MPAAVETAIWMALKGRVETLSLSPSVPVVYPKQDAPASGKYIEVADLPNRTSRLSLGSADPHRRPGILQLTLNSPVSPKQAFEVDKQTAALIAAHFPADLKLTHEDVTVHVTKAPDVAQSYRVNAYWLTPVSVYYEAFV